MALSGVSYQTTERTRVGSALSRDAKYQRFVCSYSSPVTLFGAELASTLLQYFFVTDPFYTAPLGEPQHQELQNKAYGENAGLSLYTR